MTHFVVIHALMMSWYLRKMPSNPTYDVMMNLDPWRSSNVDEVVKELLGPTLSGLMTLQPLLESWSS